MDIPTQGTDRQAAYLRQVRNRYPDLRVQTVRWIDAGMINDVLVVDESLIFRFPKTAQAVERLMAEVAVLRLVRPHLALPVPDPIFESAGFLAVGEVFIGYRLIPGEPLRDHVEALKAMGESHVLNLADQLATFLRELHAVPVGAAAPDLPVHDAARRESLPRMREDVRRELFPLMSTDAQRRVLDEFEQFLGDPRSFDYARTLKHGDLGAGNILVDPQKWVISGVVDFGSAGLDDPAADLGFVALWGAFVFGATFAERVLDRYPAAELLRRRACFFKLLIALHVALEGVRSGNRADVEFGLSQCV